MTCALVFLRQKVVEVIFLLVASGGVFEPPFTEGHKKNGDQKNRP
jgi:hypothetical protein